MSSTYVGDSTILAFELISDDPRFVNVSKTLAFELRSYDEWMPTFAIVLDFIMETGGIF